MARPISRIALNVLNSAALNPIELLDILPAGASSSDAIRLTNAGEELEWAGNTYLATNFSRSEIVEMMSIDSGDDQRVSITFSSVDGQLAALLNHVEMEGARTTLWMHDRKLLLKYPDRTRDAIELITGEIRNPVLSSEILTMEIQGILGIMDKLVLPRRQYQPGCNYTFGSTACGVDTTVAPYTLETAVLSGSTDSYVRVANQLFLDAGDPADVNDFWLNGQVVMMDGISACQGRRIHRVFKGGGERRFYVTQKFLRAPSPGDTVRIIRGCPHTKLGCVERQGDALNFGGFEEVPYGDVKPLKPIKGNPNG